MLPGQLELSPPRLHLFTADDQEVCIHNPHEGRVGELLQPPLRVDGLSQSLVNCEYS